MLLAEKPGFGRQMYGQKGENPVARPLVFHAGQRVGDLSFELTPAGVITGRVLDEEGETVAGVNVTLLRYGFSDGKRRPQNLNGARTDDRGEFRIENVAPGTYYVRAQPLPKPIPPPPADDESEYALVPSYYPASPDIQSAGPVRMPAGTHLSGIDIHFRKSRVVRIRGRIVTPAAVEAAGLSLVLFSGGIGHRGEGTVTEAIVGSPKGDFEIAGVTPGSYTLQVRKPRMSVVNHQVEVGERNVENLVINLGRSFDISGILRVDGDAAGILLSDLQVMLLPIELGSGAGASVNDRGLFTLKSVAPARYLAGVSGASGVYIKSVKLAGHAAGAGGFDVQSGGEYSRSSFRHMQGN
jgi:hypothetical protein